MPQSRFMTRRGALATLASGAAVLCLPVPAQASPLQLWVSTKKLIGKVRVTIYSAIIFPGLNIAKRKIGTFLVDLKGAIKNITRKFAGVVMKVKMWVHGSAKKALTLAARAKWKVHEVSNVVIRNI